MRWWVNSADAFFLKTALYLLVNFFKCDILQIIIYVYVLLRSEVCLIF